MDLLLLVLMIIQLKFGKLKLNNNNKILFNFENINNFWIGNDLLYNPHEKSRIIK